MKNDISLLVISCDKYHDLWEIFFTTFYKYWPDCSLTVYLVTNHLDFLNPRVKMIKIGDDISYTDNLLKAVSQIETDWVLLWLEDCMFSREIDNTKVNKVLTKAVNTPNLGFLKLSNDLPLVYDCEKNAHFGIIPRGVKYRSAIGMALYKKDVFKKLLVPGENAWQADKSSKSDSLSEDFCALSNSFFYKPLFPYVNTVVKGKWSRPAVNLLSKNGFSANLVSRPVQSFYGYFYEKIFYVWSFFLQLFKIYWFR